MAESKIESEILELVKVRTHRGDTRQDYLDRLMRAATKLSDDDWDKLSTAAHDWTNAAVESVKAKTDIADFSDTAAEEVVEETVEEAVEEQEAAPARRTRGPSKSNGTRKQSACHKIKTFVVKNPKITVEELSNKLKDIELKVSDVTIATIRSDTRDTLRVLNDAGMISVEL
jgi:hypothetical protein